MKLKPRVTLAPKTSMHISVEVGPMVMVTTLAVAAIAKLAYSDKLKYKLSSKKLDRGIKEEIQKSYAENA